VPESVSRSSSKWSDFTAKGLQLKSSFSSLISIICSYFKIW
jgi:hypothetical protein